MNEKIYYRKHSKLKNLKVPTRRKPRNDTLAKKIKSYGKKMKEEAPANAIAHGGVDMAPNMGPKFGWINPTDKRRKKNGSWSLLRRSGIQKRFKQWSKDYDKV